MVSPTLRISALAVMIAAAVQTAVMRGLPAQSGQAVEPRPRLVVVLVIDQMRADYVDKYQHQWRAGLRRLIDTGAWFRRAAYPYLHTVTCAGHATIATGTLPSNHGIVLNEWWNRAEDRRMSCTDDPAAPLLSYGAPLTGAGASPKWLRMPTLADEFRAQAASPPRIVTVSLKARSAIMLAGRRSTATVWQGPHGTWATSTAFAAAPIPALQTYFREHPVARDLGREWRLLLKDGEYVSDEQSTGARPPPPWTMTWPHVLRGNGDAPDATFYDLWQRSPFSDDYLAGLASHMIDVLRLGSGPGTDYLGISFSALDLVGHKFGPQSREVQDVLARLDVALGRLLLHLDRTVGRDQYVIALCSDHGQGPIPEQMAAEGFDAGRINQREVQRAVEQTLAGQFGTKPVSALIYTDLYLAPGVYDELTAKPELMDQVVKAIERVPGVWRVFTTRDLTGAANLRDPAAQAAARSHWPGRSGDLIVVPRPYWITSADPSTHGSSHDYDRRVPLILAGRGIRPGRYLEEVTPADIAPTLAFLTGVTLAAPDGRVLSEALAVHEPVTRRR